MMINYSDLYKCSIKDLVKTEYLTAQLDMVALMSISSQGKWKLALTATGVGLFSFTTHHNVINTTV